MREVLKKPRAKSFDTLQTEIRPDELDFTADQSIQYIYEAKRLNSVAEREPKKEETSMPHTAVESLEEA